MPIARLTSFAKLLALVLLTAVVTVLVYRMVQARLAPELQYWHTWVPDELSVSEMDAADWPAYLARESELMRELAERAHAATAAADNRIPVALNRYHPGSSVHPLAFAHDWNRSHVLKPEGEIRGAVLLLHGLTDSPYSLRHIGRHYQSRGFAVVAIRLPGHGTVPAGLIGAHTEHWLAATRLGWREAARLAGPGKPLHVVGFSNGGALALMLATDPVVMAAGQPRPAQLILVSPMVGVSGFARFAGLAGLPAYLPPFAKAAWLSNLPEFIPFKYNSFPVRAAVESHALTQQVQARLGSSERAASLPPVLAFQSVMDATVSTPAVVTQLFGRLQGPGHLLVLYDLNRRPDLSSLIRNRADAAIEKMLPPAPRAYAVDVITNGGSSDERALALLTPAASTQTQTRPLSVGYPDFYYSLSHVAVPFPPSDSLYGSAPTQRNEFGLSLGVVAPRGERGVLVTDLDTVLRATSNPFFEEMLRRIDERIAANCGDCPGLPGAAVR
ncbi:alpha/beta hydrolase [Piscinibacterium candidicorallinum]|uniref:Alpha/beta hydrolase n=1 Tax=Piscinibacterium candidicorallinum TaxID=1793872 RepID=A0ABV7GXZ6_9BURK